MAQKRTTDGMSERRARKIKAFRDSLGLDQIDFGNLFGQGQSTISIWESSESTVVIKVTTARALVKHAKRVGFPLTLDDLYGEDDDDDES
jgi:transcriptional regulator with XRE-family HTH domain